MIKIKKIDLKNKADVKAFIKQPFEIYKNNPYWVPPLLPDMYFNLDPQKHPFYKHSTAAFFLAEKDGKPAGRIAVLNNHIHNQYQNEKTAFFNYFESIDDPDVSAAIFENAFHWSKSEGLTKIVGPRGFIRTDGSGILVKGYELRSAVGITYNYPYYDKLIQAAGFEKLTDYFSGRLPLNFNIPDKVKIIAKKVRQKKGYWVKSFSSKKELREWIPRVGKVFNAAFENRKEFYPINQQELDVIANNIISVADPRLIKLVLNKEDEVIGFVLTYPDITEAIQKTGGKVWPLGWLRLLWAQKNSKVFNLNGIGLLPEYQGMGGNALLYDELFKTSQSIVYERAEAVQIDEDNFLSFSDHQTMQIIWEKTHRSYQRMIGQ